MRVRGPSEVRPRQLRILVLVLALLPLIPVTFVVRFVSEDIDNQRLEARERARPIYQRVLDATSLALATTASKQLPTGDALDPNDPWRTLRDAPDAVETVLIATPDGQLSAPPPAAPPDDHRAVTNAEALARGIVDGGIRYALLPRGTAPVRWRFLGETRDEPLFGLHPLPASPGGPGNGHTLLLVKSRSHLLEQIGAFYHREIGSQAVLRLIDENNESVSLTGPAATGGDFLPLGETILRPPLPAWRVQLFSANPELVDGIAFEQIRFYGWSVVAMIAVTGAVAGTVGWALNRRISLHELSNDALAVVSHEMKTPLASTRLLIETLLQRRYRGGEAAADEYLQLIAGENTRLERMVEGFQTLSRLERPRDGRPRLTLETVRVEEIVKLARERLLPRLEAEGCDFRVEIDENAPSFQADRDALAAVLVNLLDNALKYSGDEKRIVLRAGRENGEVIFEVVDHGVGIDRSEQGRIFERFYQSDRRLSRVHEGCGLGLSIVRSVVKAHGGTVSVTSKPGVGSTFTVRLPVGATIKTEA